MKKEDNMTAEEFIRSKKLSLNLEPIKNLMIEFAKYHVQKALEEVSEQVKVESEPDYRGGSWEYVNKNSILEAYPLENIK